MTHAPPVKKTWRVYDHILGTNTGLATRAGGGSSSKTDKGVKIGAGCYRGYLSQ